MELVQADLAIQIGRIIAERGWTQAQAAALGINESEVSRIVRGRFGDFSLGHLIEIVSQLNLDA